ncbi:MAG: hypothetical protein ACRCTZ_14035 [Sarcina sp.]
MNYLLKKLINNFITLETSNSVTFTGKVIAVIQDTLVLDGVKEPTSLISSPPDPSIPKTYNIAIDKIIWFREENCDISYSTFDINKSDSIKIITNDVILENSNKELNSIEDNINLLESLFGTIGSLVQSDTNNNLNVESKFNIELDLDFEDDSNIEES